MFSADAPANRRKSSSLSADDDAQHLLADELAVGRVETGQQRERFAAMFQQQAFGGPILLLCELAEIRRRAGIAHDALAQILERIHALFEREDAGVRDGIRSPREQIGQPDLRADFCLLTPATSDKKRAGEFRPGQASRSAMGLPRQGSSG